MLFLAKTLTQVHYTSLEMDDYYKYTHCLLTEAGVCVRCMYHCFIWQLHMS